MPVSKFITGSTYTNRLYCADLTNHLYVIDMATDQILVTHTFPTFTDQLSTSVVYNSDVDIVYWMVNFWDGPGGTKILAFDGLTGVLLTQRQLSGEIIDMAMAGGSLFITMDDDFWKLDPITLQTVSTHTQTGRKYKRIFQLNNSEIGVSYSYIVMGQNRQKSQIFDIASHIALQDLGPETKHVYDVQFYNPENIVMCTLVDDFTTFNFFDKNGGSTYNHVGIPITLPDLFAKKLRVNDAGNYAYIAGQDIGRIYLPTRTLQMSNNLEGCMSYDIIVKNMAGSDVIFSANPIEGTFSKHNQDCSKNLMKQTAFKTNTGCINDQENKAYFVNNKSMWEKSGLAIINCETDEIIDIIQLGKNLIQAVYSADFNKVFVASHDDNQLYVINGQTNQLIQTINLQHSPEFLFSTGNNIYCKAKGLTEDALYVINAANYTITQISLPSTVFGRTCRKMILNDDATKLFMLLCNTGFSSIARVDLSTSTIDQIEDFTFIGGYDLEYNLEEDLLYFANLTLPKFYVIDPANLNVLNTVSYKTEVLFHSLNIEVDYYRNKVYVNCAQEDLNTYIGHYLTIIDLDDYSYQTVSNDDIKSASVFNPINEQFFYNTLVDNQTNPYELPELSIGVKDCLDDSDLNNINTGNILNRNYIVGQKNDEIHPITNSSTNKIYWPNGDFSNISVIKAHTDKIGLQDGWNWISFPRLERVGNDYTPTIPVLERVNYFPDLDMTLWDQAGLYKNYQFPNWTGDLDNVRSTKGYRLELDLTDSPMPDIALHGAKLDPSISLTIYPNTENWVGYFVEDAQLPEDAIPEDVLDVLTVIKAQYWAMFKSTTEPYTWKIKGQVTPIHYGDMLILESDAMASLQWNQPQEAAEEMETLFPEYYEYEEQATYLPIFIETDENSDIDEIAVLANGEVVGAAVRLPGDTLVEVNAYLEDVPSGTPLEFETWSDYKSAPIDKGSYSVKNRFNGLYEKRSIYKGERAKYHIASLKAGTVAQSPANISDANCAPNPFRSETLFTFRLNSTGPVSLCVYNQNGKLVRELMNGELAAGYYTIPWDGVDKAGNRLGDGLYFYKLTSGNGDEVSGKVVLIK